MFNNLFNFFPYLHKYGILGLIQRIYHPLADHYFEKRFQVHTIGSIQKADLGIEHDESIHYSPVSYKHIFYMLNRILLKKSASTFLDYGCGKGRVLIAAASCDYEQIIGVELADIIQNAKENVKNMKFRKTKKVAFEQMDATDFVIPTGVNVTYFFNPFLDIPLKKWWKIFTNRCGKYRENCTSSISTTITLMM